jgi:hypothetical protein
MPKKLDKNYTRKTRLIQRKKKTIKQSYVVKLHPLDVPYQHRNKVTVGKLNRPCFFCKVTFGRKLFYLHKCPAAAFHTKAEYEKLLPEGPDGFPHDPNAAPYEIFHGGIEGMRNGVLKGNPYATTRKEPRKKDKTSQKNRVVSNPSPSTVRERRRTDRNNRPAYYSKA